MLVILLVISGILAAMAAGFIFVLQAHHIKTGKIVIDPNYDGGAEVSKTLHITIRYIFKRSVYVRKFVMQYVAHLLVRVMYYLDIATSHIYAKSRNWFVKNAVRNRGTVPHFWEHLKVYKQEMDKEREEEE